MGEKWEIPPVPAFADDVGHQGDDDEDRPVGHDLQPLVSGGCKTVRVRTGHSVK